MNDNPISIGKKRQLFVDDYLIDKVENLKLNVHSWQKHPSNPLLIPDKPWEGAGNYALVWGSVIFEEELNRYRMWYWTSAKPDEDGEMMCCALSGDGLQWEKPSLGIHRFQGSTDNNIVMISEPELNDMETYGVIHCPQDPDPERLYKSCFWEKRSEEQRGVWSATSPDGFNWTKSPEPIAPHGGDTVGFFFDGLRNKYLTFVKVRTDRRRSRAQIDSDDFLSWTEPRLILKTDERDNQPCDLYNNTGFVWESMYLGLLQVYYHHLHPYESKLVVELIYSRDGVQWHRMPNRNTILDVGPDGSWDRTNQGVMNGPPVVTGDQMHIYYGGRTYFHPPYSHGERRSSIGMASLRRDGFASRDASPIEGYLETKTLLLNGDGLHMNVKSDWGKCQVAILDDSGQPLSGLARENCEPIREDSTDVVVRFTDRKSLKSISKKTVKIRFHLQNAQLFSFWME